MSRNLIRERIRKKNNQEKRRNRLSFSKLKDPKRKKKKKKGNHLIIQIYFLSKHDRSIALDIARFVYTVFDTIHTFLLGQKKKKERKKNNVG